jgi:hypothetical protein
MDFDVCVDAHVIMVFNFDLCLLLLGIQCSFLKVLRADSILTCLLSTYRQHFYLGIKQKGTQ